MAESKTEASPKNKTDEIDNSNAPGHIETREVRTDSVVRFRARPSMMSSEHPETNYRGFVNVLIILLVRRRRWTTDFENPNYSDVFLSVNQ